MRIFDLVVLCVLGSWALSTPALAQPGPPGPGPRPPGPRPGPQPLEVAQQAARGGVDAMTRRAERNALLALAGKESEEGSTTSSSTELVQIWHAPIPADPRAILRTLSEKLPRDLDLEALLKEHEDEVLGAMNAGLSGMVFVAREDLSYRSQRLPAGRYSLGLRFKGPRLLGAVLSGDSLKKPLQIAVKLSRLDPAATLLSVRVAADERESKRGIRSVRLHVGFGRAGGVSKVTFRAASKRSEEGPAPPAPGPRGPGPRPGPGPGPR